MVTISCERCGKEFSDPQYLSKAQYKLNVHKGRENPCDAPEGAPYKVKRAATFAPPSIESLDLSGLMESLHPNIRDRHVISFIFSKLNEVNKFAVWPNTKLYEIVYKTEGHAQYVTPGQFMLAFWHEVLQKQVVPLLKREWPRYPEFYKYTKANTTWEFLETETFRPGMVNAFLRSELYKDTKAAITAHLKQVTRSERAQLKVNMAHIEIGTALYIATTGDRSLEPPKKVGPVKVPEPEERAPAPWDF